MLASCLGAGGRGEGRPAQVSARARDGPGETRALVALATPRGAYALTSRLSRASRTELSRALSASFNPSARPSAHPSVRPFHPLALAPLLLSPS
eukprot:2293705-Pleurochrysis_carterae.AAC.1